LPVETKRISRTAGSRGAIVATSFDSVAAFLQRGMPIFIPAFNNPTYVRNMVNQLRTRRLRNIVVIDNASTSGAMRELLGSDFGATVVRLERNEGPTHVFMDEENFRLLPEFFCVTDPDLELNPHLPEDFLAILAGLTERFQVGKAGFSLDISEPDAMHAGTFPNGGGMYTITEWEQQYWRDPIAELEGIGTVYRATIDTTFAVYNKKFLNREYHYAAVRVAGSFTCKHLPWYRTTIVPAEEEAEYRTSERFSSYLKEVRPRLESSRYAHLYDALNK
jgi:hypothetical protein